MKALIAFALALVAALFATAVEERAFNGAAGGWFALIVGGSVFVIFLHIFQQQEWGTLQ